MRTFTVTMIGLCASVLTACSSETPPLEPETEEPGVSEPERTVRLRLHREAGFQQLTFSSSRR